MHATTMVKESALRKCSHCGSNGHNSRTCNGKSVMLFGVNIGATKENNESIMKKSVSMENLESCEKETQHVVDDSGYNSDGIIHHKRAKANQERKRGKPWSPEEHRNFLAGLKQLGRGDWRGIAKNFVTTRTPTQVASHAQKYFLRKASGNRRRRASLFDIPLESDKTPEDLPGSSLSVNAAVISPQAYPTHVTNMFPARRFQDSALSPSYHHMIRVPGAHGFESAKIVQAVFAPMVNYHPGTHGYAYRMKNHDKLVSHPSGIPTPPQTSTHADAATVSPIEKNFLQLQIQQPQISKAANMSSQTSGAISVT